MKTVAAISDLPNAPAVDALYGGQGKGMYVAYVGLAKQLKTRIIQHLVRHDSSVTTGVQAVSLNPDFVTKVGWWEHNDFSDPFKLAAAELIAFDVLDPALRMVNDLKSGNLTPIMETGEERLGPCRS